MIERVPATVEHLAQILENPSRQTAGDMEALQASKEAMIEYFGNMLPDEDSETALCDGRPVGMIGWEKWPTGLWFSWSAGTPEGYDPKRPAFVLMQKRFFRDVAKRNPGVSLMMKPIVTVDRRMKRWMGTLGFAWLPDQMAFLYRRVDS